MVTQQSDTHKPIVILIPTLLYKPIVFDTNTNIYILIPIIEYRYTNNTTNTDNRILITLIRLNVQAFKLCLKEKSFSYPTPEGFFSLGKNTRSLFFENKKYVVGFC